MSDFAKITVMIANRKYTLSVEKKDEQVIRDATEQINNQVFEYQKRYKGKDVQDILAMILLNLAASKEKEESPGSHNMTALQSRLEDINQLLEKAV